MPLLREDFSKYQPQQEVCGEADCQKRRRTEYRRQKLNTDEEYRQVCRDSSRKWRSRNPGYWKGYREKHPDAVAQNREKQQGRDSKQRLLDLANNTSALDLKRSAAAVWLLNAEAADLAHVPLLHGHGAGSPGRVQPHGVHEELQRLTA